MISKKDLSEASCKCELPAKTLELDIDEIFEFGSDASISINELNSICFDVWNATWDMVEEAPNAGLRSQLDFF